MQSTYCCFLQKPSLPFVTTRQFVSFSKPFIPVSVPVAGLTLSVLPFLVNSIASPLAVPSYFFAESRFLISTSKPVPFFVIFRYVPSGPFHFPTIASTFAEGFASSPGEAFGLAAAEELG